jgi:hypothetical protein
MADSPEKVPRWTSKSEHHAHDFEKINGNIQGSATNRDEPVAVLHIEPSFTRSGKRHDNRGKEKRQPEAKHLELRHA